MESDTDTQTARRTAMQAPTTGLLAGTIITVLSTAGYVGLAGLMAIESACIPLPSEIILPFAGYLVSQGTMNLLVVATVGALGCNIGSALAYADHGKDSCGILIHRQCFD